LLTIQEKVDGSNLGFALVDGELQFWNRGKGVNEKIHPQWTGLEDWLDANEGNYRKQIKTLLQMLLKRNPGTTPELFGEWCQAQHTVYYSALTSKFVAFDIFDGKEFLSQVMVHKALKQLKERFPLSSGVQIGIPTVPILFQTSNVKDMNAETLLRIAEESLLTLPSKLVDPEKKCAHRNKARSQGEE